MHLPERLGLDGLCTPVSGLSYPIPELFLLLFLIYRDNGQSLHGQEVIRGAMHILLSGFFVRATLDLDSTTNTLAFNRPQPG